MGKDPAESYKFTSFGFPPTRGPGSGKEAWVQFGLRLADANNMLSDLVDQQSNLIAYLEAKLAERKPKGGRPPVSDRTLAAIRADLASGLTQRQAAARNGVSPMTVSRLAKLTAAS